MAVTMTKETQTHMKKTILSLGLFAVLAGVVSQTQAQSPSFTSHYVPGVEGVKGASLPPPGIYIRDYNVFYWANRLNAPDGGEVPNNFDAFVYANLLRPIWITELKVLGGYYGMDMIVPFQYTDFSVTGGGDNDFAIGDLYFEPATLSWHGKQWDAAVGYSFFAPTASSELGTAKPGKGFWTHMLTAGATAYFDEEKTWSLSALNRYEFNTEQEDTDITPGQVWTLEWGAAKGVTKTIEVGACGYFQFQTTEDSGPNASSDLDRAIGVGPEVTALWPATKIMFSLRYLYEVEARDRPQGNTVTLTLTRGF
jgi:hypothetical protein